MEKRFKEIIVSDSRSENMVRRLLDISRQERSRRQRWLLLANGGLIRSLESDNDVSDQPNWRR